jgi:hypothetical protein
MKQFPNKIVVLIIELIDPAFPIDSFLILLISFLSSNHSKNIKFFIVRILKNKKLFEKKVKFFSPK